MSRKTASTALLLTAVLTVGGCVAGPEAPLSFEAREALSLVDQAEGLAHAGDWRTAVETARAGLAAARASGHVEAEAAALRVLGTAGRDLAPIDAADAISASLDDDEGRSRADLARSIVLTALDRPDEAGAAAERGLSRLGADEVLDHGELIARLHHAHAAALRADERFVEASSAERRAELALTTLPDDGAPALRLAIALARGIDTSSAGDPHAAFRHHARASWFARRTDRPHAELRAVVGMAGDCLALGRRRDAVAMIERALRLAVTLDPPSPESVDVLERSLRKHLLALDDGPGSVRWERLDALVADHAARLAR